MKIRKPKQTKTPLPSVKKNTNTFLFRSKSGEYEYKHEITLQPFPSEKARENVYKVWAQTYLEAITKNKE